MKPVFLSTKAEQKFYKTSIKNRKSILFSNSKSPGGSLSINAVLIGRKVAVYIRRIIITMFQKFLSFASGRIIKGRRFL